MRVSSVGKFTDLHGEAKRVEVEALASKLGAKAVAAHDEKKNLLCWSLAHQSTPENVSARLVGEMRSFAVSQLLIADGWMLGPEGSIHNEVILYHP